MMCLSKTLFPVPLGPIRTKSSPGLTVKRDASEDFQRPEALAEVADLDLDVFQLCGAGAHFETDNKNRVRK